MAEIVNTLFGVTPESYRQAQQQQADAQALQYAKLDPFQQANYAIGRGANMLGGVIGGALGGQDPELQRITRRQQIAGQLNPNDLSTFEQAMAALAPTDPQGAMMVRAELEKIQMGQAKLASENALTGQRKAETLAKLREKQALDPVQKLLETGRYTPASVADFRESGDPTVLTLVEKEVKGPAPNIKEVGTAVGSGKAVYTYQTADGVQQITFETGADGQQIMKPYVGPVDRTTSQTNVGLKLPEGESEFLKELGKLDAKKVSEALTASGDAINLLTTLKKMAEVVQRPVISGSLAEKRTDVSNFFNTIGLSSNADRIKTANSQEYQKYSTELVLDNLKKTGYNPSNADMKVVQAIIPRLETDPIARNELIQFMAEKANLVITEADNLNKYARTNKGLSGYKPSIPQINFSGVASQNPYSGLSDAELEARIKRAQSAQPKK